MAGEQLLAAQFGLRINREGRRDVGFAVLARYAIKYIVRAVVHQRRGELARELSEGADQIGIQREGLGGVILGAVDIVESDAINDSFGSKIEVGHFGA